MSHRLLITGGRVHDGSHFVGAAQVLIEDDRIATVGNQVAAEDSSVDEVIDATGCVVCPGFIELHNMTQQLDQLDGNDAVNLTAQGVTTCMIGNCGQSGTINEPDAFGRGNDRLDAARLAINIARLLGHNSLRAFAVPAPTRPSSADELGCMVDVLDRAIAAGAVGMSSGLMYSPGVFAERAEMETLSVALGRSGRLYTTHLRDEGDALEEAVNEAIDVAAAGGVRLLISHLKATGAQNWGKTERVIAQIEARRRDCEIYISYYPYNATSTVLRIVLPPDVLRRVGDDFKRLEVRDEDRRLTEKEGKQTLCPDGWADVVIVTSQVAGTVGKSIADLGGDGYATVIDLLRRDPETRASFHNIVSEDELMQLAALPYAMVVSDGYVFPTGSREATHPRNYGAFARMLKYFANRDLEGFIRRTTSLPANVAKLGKRGRLEPGWAADVTVFKPELVRDTSDYEQPWRLAEGVKYTLVNGQTAFASGRATGRMGGRRIP